MQNTAKPLRLLKMKLFKGYNDQEQKIHKIYQHKIIKYGQFTEVHDYFQLRASFSFTGNTGTRNIPKPKSDYALQRAKQHVFQIVEANHLAHGAFKTIFVTLTFARQTDSRAVADRRVALFIKRLSRHCGHKIKYVFVPERHISGNIHYHGVLFNMPFIPVDYLEKKIYWYGDLDLDMPKSLKNVTHYISKYITKDVLRTARKGEKTYLAPRGIHVPNTTLDFFEPDDTLRVVQETYLSHKKITKYAKV